MTKADPTVRLQRYGKQLQSDFVDEAAEIAADAAAATPNNLPTRWSHLGKVAAVLLTGVIGVSSLGIVADAAVPGQLLYPVDQSTERVLNSLGLSTADQRLAERIHEAQVLLDRDQPGAALETLLGALRREFGELPPEEAAEHAGAIRQTAENAVSIGDPSQVGALADMAQDVRDHIGAGDADSAPAGATDRDELGAGGGDQ